MSTWRLLQINQLIRKELSRIFLKEGDFPKNILTTITRVETTADLKESKVFISILPEKETDKILRVLNRKIYFIQQALNKELKIRSVPKIKFLEEKQLKEAAEIEKIFKKIQKEKNEI